MKNKLRKKMGIISNMITIDCNQKHTSNLNKHISFIVNKTYLSEYNNTNAYPDEAISMRDEILTTSNNYESVVIKYLLDIMITHDIITKEEYQAVLYKYS